LSVPHRPLALVSGLTLGDYLLWNWSLNGNHDVLALVSGLTLPPLAVACLWLFALTLARLLARSTRRSHTPQRGAGHAQRDSERRAGEPATASTPTDQAPAPATSSSARSSGKLAA
jgi:hypothetical protein